MLCRPAARLRAATAAALILAALPAAAQDAGAEAAAPSPDAVVATVNGVEITLGEVILLRQVLPERFQSFPDEQLFEALVQQAINQALMAEVGRAAGAGDTPLARLTRLMAEREFLAEAAMREVIEGATTEAALRELYRTRFVEAEPVEEVRASHILVDAEEKAAALRAELEAGADFAALAAEHGTDGTSTRGGDLGWFARERMVAPFAEAAFAGAEGELLGPVETQFGWHLILVTGRREAPVPDFEAVRADLAREAAEAAAEAALVAAREGAEIKLAEDGPAPAAIRRDEILTAAD